MTMQIRLLSTEHLDELLAFEMRNRDWFESHIAPRPEGVYTRSAVKTHIEQLNRSFHAGTAYPGIIEAQGQLVGRVNLTKILDTETVRIGYRIDRDRTGRGLASAAVAHMRKNVGRLFDCSSLTAFVSVENHASQRVLTKNGFKAVRRHAGHAMAGDRMLDCIEYELPIALR